MNKVLRLVRKELLYTVRDTKTFITSIVISVLLVPLLFLGINLITDLMQKMNEQKVVKIGILSDQPAVNERFINALKDLENVEVLTVESKESAVEKVKSSELAGYLEIKDRQGENTGDLLNIDYVYDERTNHSSASVVKINALATEINTEERQQLLSELGTSENEINPLAFAPISVQSLTGDKVQSQGALFLIPYLIILGLIQTSMQYAIELTAGEKERNTLTTTLTMNVSLREIGLSKALTTVLLSLFFTVLNLISVTTALSIAPQGEGFGEFTLTPIAALQLSSVVLPLSVLTSSLMILIGIYARNVKEGGIYATPLLMVTVFVAVSGAAFDLNSPAYLFLVPFVGHVAAMKQVLLGAYIPLNNLILIGSTFFFFVILMLLTIRMFRTESVLFRR